MNKLRIRKKIILSKRKKYTYIFISIIIVLFISFSYINKKISPLYLDIAENEVKKISNIIINDSIDNKLSKKISNDNLFSVKKNSKNEISSIDFNTVTVNQFLYEITNHLQKGLKYIESGDIEKIKSYNNILLMYDKRNLKKGIVCRIPLGNIFNNTLLSNLGGSIPVRLNLIGNIMSNIRVKTINYGINNTLVEIYADIKLSMEVILPYTKKKSNIKTSIPIGMKMIQGTVPSYYSNSSSPLTIPMLNIS